MIPSHLVPPLHPASSKWYWLEWRASELGASVTISTSRWGALANGDFVATLPAGLQADAVYASGLVTGVRLSVTSAVEGAQLEVVNQIVTSAGETLHETLPITIDAEGH
jgi:hypothetical protein